VTVVVAKLSGECARIIHQQQQHQFDPKAVITRVQKHQWEKLYVGEPAQIFVKFFIRCWPAVWPDNVL
jgi:hypothetical protein